MTPLPDSLLEAVASAAVREGLADAIFTRLSTPLGRLLVVQGPDGIVRVGFEEESEDAVLAEVAGRLGPRIVGSDRELAGTRDALSAYLEGEDDTLDLPVDLGLVSAPFRRAVLETLHREVGRGDVVTYGGLAERSGRPKAYRAAATACARNPVPIVVPCHRVLPSGGGIGDYAGGAARKLALLELEGAIFP
jgi:methylated-DNA-[protein]-cysteine S-methyltransferase